MSLIWLGYISLLAVAAATDAVRYKIPNWISLALVGLLALAATAGEPPLTSYWDNLLLAVIAFAIGYALFEWTGMGAGDAKLATAVALWSGFAGLYQLVFWLAVSMSALAIGLIVLRRAAKLIEPAQSVRVFQVGAPVPLGVALAAAGVLASGAFKPSLWIF